MQRCSGFLSSLKGNLHNVQSPDVLQVEDKVLKFLASGSHLVAPTLIPNWKRKLQKEKEWCYLVNAENLGEASAHSWRHFCHGEPS